MTEKPERRQSQRNRPEQLIYVELGPDNGGMMLNVSEDGFSFRAVNPVQPNGNIRFALLIDGTRLEGTGELEWARENGKVGGLRFTEVSKEFRREIRRLLTKSQPLAGSWRVFIPAVAAPVDTQEKPRSDLNAEPPKAEPVAPLMEKPELKIEAPPASNAGIPELEKETAPAPGLPAMDARGDEAVPGHVKPKMPQESTLGRASAIASKRRGEPALWLNAVERAKAKRFATTEEVQTGSLPPPRLSRAAVVGIVAAILLVLSSGIYSFRREVGESLIWLGENLAGETKPVEPGRPVEVATLPVTPTVNPPVNPPTRSPADAYTNPVPAKGPSIQEAPSTTTSSSELAAPGTPPEEPGKAELAEAQRILGRKDGSRDITGAMKLLWIAVQKGNTTAVLTLSDLYARGQVVAQNCVQARVLLTVAAKKGSVEAKARLGQLSQQGCE
jgi:PilZ domain